MKPTPTPPTWWRSTRCEAGHCVEVARDGSRFAIRDAKNPTGPAGRAFIDAARTGHLDLESTHG